MKWRCRRDAGRAAGSHRAPKAAEQRAGGRVAGGSARRQSARAPGTAAERTGDAGRREQSCAGSPARPAEGARGGHGAHGPARRPHSARSRRPRHRPPSRAGARSTAAHGESRTGPRHRVAARAPLPSRGAPRSPGPPPAAGSQTPATFPVPSTRCPLRLTLSQQAPSSTNSRQNSNPREIPPAAFPCSSPPPLPSASLSAATRPPRRLSPLRRRREPATSRRPRTRGSCSLPSLETYPGDGACAGRSSAGEPSV